MGPHSLDIEDEFEAEERQRCIAVARGWTLVEDEFDHDAEERERLIMAS
jgi:hypothetical protein